MAATVSKTSTTPDEGAVAPPEPEEADFYEQTRFWAKARKYGLGALVLTWGTAFAAGATALLVFLSLEDALPAGALQALAVAYTSIAAALFGIVLAGLAVVAAFFDKAYAALLRAHGVLDRALFAFWWVAALAVVALFASVGFVVVTWATTDLAPTTIALGVASFFFTVALAESLALVGSMMRHGLYRAELAEQEMTVRRQQDA